MRLLPLATESLPLRPQDEVRCNRCDVHCDKIVYPAACLERSCPFVYAYEDDLHLLLASERTRAGFGAVRATRKPLPMCRAEVSSCYERRQSSLGCVNPEFFELPVGEPAFRVLAQVAQDA